MCWSYPAVQRKIFRQCAEGKATLRTIPLPPHAPESSATAQQVSAVSTWHCFSQHTNLKMTKIGATMEDTVKIFDDMLIWPKQNKQNKQHISIRFN